MSEPQRKPLSATSSRYGATGKIQNGCWVDFFEGPIFSGKLKRLRGPAEFGGTSRRANSPGSLIVGPQAVLVVFGIPKDVALPPKQIVADLSKTRFAGTLGDFRIVLPAESPV